MSVVTIAQGGVLPNIWAVLLPKKNQGVGGKGDEKIPLLNHDRKAALYIFAILPLIQANVY